MRKTSTILVKRDMIMKKMKVIGYWVTTVAVALELLAGGVTDLIHGGTELVAGQPVVQIVTHEGYPVYLLTILGVWKIPGTIAVLTLASWALRPPSRTLGVLFPAQKLA